MEILSRADYAAAEIFHTFLSTPFVHAFLLMPFPKVHPLGKGPVPGRGGFAGFGLSPPPGQRCDLFYFALESPRCWTGPAAVGLSFQVRLPWV